MALMRGLALLLFTFLAYAAGATAAERGRQPVPRPADLAIAIAIWLAGLWANRSIGHWRAVALALITASVAAGLRGLVHRSRPLDAEAARAHAVRDRDHHAPRAGTGWRAFLTEMGNYQGRLTLAVMYIVLLGPFALIARATSDPLHKRRPTGTAWIARDDPASTLDAARRQF